MKQKRMHDGLGSGPLLNVAMKLPKNIHHHVFCVFNKHIFFCTKYEEDDDHYPRKGLPTSGAGDVACLDTVAVDTVDTIDI